jgi:hypothetical protein
VKPYRDALAEDGIPVAQFAVEDLTAEPVRLTERGVVFTQPPTDAGAVIVAVFDDTCGNLIQPIETKQTESHPQSLHESQSRGTIDPLSPEVSHSTQA